MSILDRLFSKETGGKREKTSQRASSMKINSELDKSAAEAKEQHPEDSKTVDNFVQVVKEARRVRRKKALEGTMEPMNAEPKFFLSQDRLAAYACLLPPENGGEALPLETFLEDMRYEGIVCGVLEETIPPSIFSWLLPYIPGGQGNAAPGRRRRQGRGAVPAAQPCPLTLYTLKYSQ